MIETLAIIYYSFATISILVVLCQQCKPKLIEFKKKYIDKNNYKYEKICTTEYVNFNELNNQSNIELNNQSNIELNNQLNIELNNQSNIESNNINLNEIKKKETTIIHFE